MNSLKDIAKGGWHPEKKDGKKTSWRGENKGINQIAGWMGKGKDPYQDAREHQSTPLSSLKDPASFEPPPKHVKYHGPAATSTSTTPGRGSVGAPVPQEQRLALHHAEHVVEEEEERPAPPPPGPYRVDTTGLNTSNLPKPPVRRAGPGIQSSGPTAQSAKPALPPRLPPRQNSHPDTYTPAPPPAYHDDMHQPSSEEGYINRTALNRLGQAGVSVPSLNIGRTASSPIPPRSSGFSSHSTEAPGSSTAGSRGPQLSELQARFSKMSTSSSPAPASPSTGTSLAQKQAALKTASSFKNDPSSVSASDLKSAASTANNFRERHGEQAGSGWKAASGLNQRYGIMDKVSNYTSDATSTPPASGAAVPSETGSPIQSGIGKKPPPPPPPKKTFLGSGVPEPPPVPLGSKPRP